MSTILEQLQYGFDRDSRRTWRRRSLTTGEDNAYGYDGLNQVTQAALGNLNQNTSAISAVPAEVEAFDYDPTGNWRGYHIEDDGSLSLDQSRVHDKGNRLTQIDNDPSPVLLDRAGRMTQVSPDASGDWNESQQMKWDAWGRITQVMRASDGEVLGAYAYDGLTRRTTRTVDGTTSHCYYSDRWRPLEERNDANTTPATQYYWGARHRDDLVRRDRTTTDDGSLNETRYVLMDYFSPAAIIDQAGNVTERYAFSAFGIRRILAPDFSPRTASECDFEFAFQGQFLDTESGFLNYGYRYYSPALGRWLSKDPLLNPQFVTGNLPVLLKLYGISIPNVFNGSAYLFVTNDPLQTLDILGLDSVTLQVITVIRPPDIEQGVKSYQVITIDEYGNITKNASGAGNTNAFFGAPTGTVVATPTVSGTNPNFTVTLTGRAWSATLGPTFDIDWTITFQVNFCSHTGTFSGVHDKYPSYIIKVNSTKYFDYQQQGSALDLLGVGNIPVPSTNFQWTGQ